MSSDPYVDWLELPPKGSGPRSHYQLLGLRKISASSEEIAAAFETQYAKVRRYEVGNYGQQAGSILQELSEAFACLNDPVRRRKYNSELRRDRAIRRTQIEDTSVRDTLTDSSLPPFPETELLDTAFGDDPLDEIKFESATSGVAAGETQATIWPKSRGFLTNVQHWVGTHRPQTAAIVGGVGVVLVIIAVLTLGKGKLGSPSTAANTNGGSVPTILDAARIDATSTNKPGAVPNEPSPAVSPSIRPPVTEVTIAGKLLNFVIYKSETKDRVGHLLIAPQDASEPVEIVVVSERVLDAMEPYVSAAENPNSPSEVRLVVTECVIDGIVPRLITTNEGLKQLCRIEMSDGSRQIATDANDNVTFGSAESSVNNLANNLRTVGNVQRINGLISKIELGTPTHIVMRFGTAQVFREVHLDVPEGWRKECELLKPATLVQMNLRVLDPSATSNATKKLLRGESIGAPPFAELETTRRQKYKDKRFKYLAHFHGASLNNQVCELTLNVMEPEQEYRTVLTGNIRSADIDFVRGLHGQDPLVVEVEVGYDGLSLVSIGRLDTYSDRIEFVVPAKETDLADAPQAPSPSVRSSGLSLVPKAIDLPEKGKPDVQRLFSVDAASGELQLDLDSRFAKLSSSQKFNIGKEATHWSVQLETLQPEAPLEKTPVCKLAVQNNFLMFQWSAEASAVADQLRNCILRVTDSAGVHFVCLRTPVRSASLALVKENEKTAFTIRGSAPAENNLECDLGLQVNGRDLSPDTKVFAFGKRIDFTLDPSTGLKGVVTCRITAEGQIQVVAGIVDKNRRGFLTPQSIKEMVENVQSSIARTEKGLNELDDELAAARARVNATSGNRAAFERGIVDRLLRSIDTKKKSLTRMRSTELPELSQLSSRFSSFSSSTIIVRIVARDGNLELPLFVAGDP